MSTGIEWTNETWNPLAGCSPVSEGCRHCYAAKGAVRLAANPNERVSAKYAGTAEMRGAGASRRAVFTGQVNLDEVALEKPLRWRKPRRVFVNSMSDLFHEQVPFDFIDRVFAVMALTPRHTYQILTKRPERMAEYLSDSSSARRYAFASVLARTDTAADKQAEHLRGSLAVACRERLPWPLKNVWLGTSVEDQAAANQRIPRLLRCPAAVRFVSCEPLLGPVDLHKISIPAPSHTHWSIYCRGNPLSGRYENHNGPTKWKRINWVIAGGESGPGARPMQIDWVRDLVRQCRAAGVPAFVKQLGARPYDHRERCPGCPDCGNRECGTAFDLHLADKKGGDWSEWPEDLRVREFPEAAHG